MDVLEQQQPSPSTGISSLIDEGDALISREQEVARWTARIKKAKARWEPDFERMRQNMEFVGNLQWDEQTKVRDESGRYICNLTLGAVKSKEAQLYARNPQVEAVKRKRLDFQLWDESIEMLQDAFMRVQASMQQGVPDMEALAVMQDFMQGRQAQKLVDKVCKTLEIVYQYQVDTSTPDFKAQMKKMVCRIITCGVGYVIPNMVVESANAPSTSEAPHSMVDRAKLARSILDKLEQEQIDMDSPELEVLRSLFVSLGVSQQTGDYQLNERIEFDWPPATSIIPDANCRDLQDFVAAKFVAQEFCLSVDEINTFFGLTGEAKIKLEGSVKTTDDEPRFRVDGEVKEPAPTERKAFLWRVFDITTKTEFFIVDGHKDYIREPIAQQPCVKGFWPIVAITFNNIEVETETRASIFPLSDVDLMRDPQKEWNRTRDALRAQRNANAPKYLARKNILSEDDKEKLRNAEPNDVIELEQVPADMTPDKVVVVMQVAQIDPRVYDTAPLEQDLQLAARVQQANLGPAQPDVTATVGTIAEQSRITVSSSNVDDLDMGLSRLAFICGQMLLQGMSEATAKQIAGPGATWPETDKATYLNQIELTIKAASSGRPNQALKASLRERIVPLLLNAGANPIAVIEELVHTLDDQLDVQKFFPIPGQNMPVGNPASAANGATPSPRGAPVARVSQVGSSSGSTTAQPLQRGLPPTVSPTPLAAG